MEKWSRTIKGIIGAAIVLTLLVPMAFAGGIDVIPGSRDKEGSVGKDGKSFENGFINSVCSEGATSNTFETCIYSLDPTADRSIYLPDSSGTVQLTSGSFAGSLADTKILVGSAAGTAAEKAHTLTGDVTGTMANSGGLAATITANSVGAQQANLNTVTLQVANTTSTNSVTVDSTHTLMSYYITTLGGVNGANLINDLYYEGSGVWTISMVNALQGGDATWTLKFLKAD
jgi:hypothetical protein